MQAGALGHKGEVFVLDMGEPIRIADLARDPIALPGLKLGEDIEIEFTGLRPGEKLYEGLYANGEQYARTKHEKILVVRNGATEGHGTTATKSTEPRKARNHTESGQARGFRDIPCHSVASVGQANGGDMGLLHEDITREVIGAAFEMQKALGHGFLERVYVNAMVVELGLRQIEVDVEHEINVHYKGSLVGHYWADLRVAGSVLVEVKCEKAFNPRHEAQLLNYLKATGVKVGQLVNFGEAKCEVKGMVMCATEAHGTTQATESHGKTRKRRAASVRFRVIPWP